MFRSLSALLGSLATLACGASGQAGPQIYEQAGISFSYPADWTVDDAFWIEAQDGFQMLSVAGPHGETLSVAWFASQTDAPLEEIEPQMLNLARNLFDLGGQVREAAPPQHLERTLAGGLHEGLRREYTSQAPSGSGGLELTVYRVNTPGRTAPILTLVNTGRAQHVRAGFAQVLDSLSLS